MKTSLKNHREKRISYSASDSSLRDRMFIKTISPLIGAVPKVDNSLTAKAARITQRAQYIDNQNCNFAPFAVSLRPLRLKNTFETVSRRAPFASDVVCDIRRKNMVLTSL